MKTKLLLAFMILLSVYGQAQIRVACVGNSITFGAGIKNQVKDSYPAVLGQMLGSDYDVRNFGFSARTLLLKGDHPYMKEQMFKDALDFNPQIVFIKLGTNDTKPQNWKYKKDFKKNLEMMVDSFLSLSSKPTIYLCYPARVYATMGGINDSIIMNSVIPYINEVAKKKKLKTIDLHTVLSDVPALFPDYIHPNEEGVTLIAKEIYRTLTGKEAAYVLQPFPGVKSQWNGYDSYRFMFNGREAIAVSPKQAAGGNPWIWRPAFFGAFPSVDIALLDKGFHVVYYDLTHLYGSPRSVKLGTDFYRYMTANYRFSPKVTLEGFSRGGLFAFNWAAANTDKVACIYVDAPVCDVFSWPGRKNVNLWNDLLKEWNLTDEQMSAFNGNPIDGLKPLAEAGIPIISVCGDSDKVVPYTENMEVIRNRYSNMGAPVEVILKAGVDHHPHSLENPEPVVNFILRHQQGYTDKVHLTVRGSLNNSLTKFAKEGKARVAFLGGSITEMNGWRTQICEQLKQRFPQTIFEFIAAGIGSTGTTPGAFRLQKDVLSKGDIDLLFVEAAVNDHTNGFSAIEQIRGMEGEVRHALTVNPMMDIVMLHFIYDPFIPIVATGQIPDVILNHEKVADYYNIPSINLCQEIGERMTANEFNWEQFGGTHPLPFGHTFYAAAINHLFDKMWSVPIESVKMAPHAIPLQPMDAYSYFNGEFISIKEAKLGKGWSYTDAWKPAFKVECRQGFVNVPMIEATQPKASFKLTFEGRAIGLFCIPGPDAGIIEYSVDGAPFKKKDTYTKWSSSVYLPWVYMLETELKPGKHKLVVRLSKEKNEASAGTSLQIRNFVVNR